ncbi:glycerol-3-phosphate 1-O-acyltransferase PlsY [Mycoplasmopsis alligatoris]|uniref:Glycerol-3-phosphate acyltransferase n=1 Tax=Mycoplasmopsis alligatoris A21JP2 TaxID=747682 RepID=D4XWA1_9BACT|nr:glycerol-3-phosphate 1-O-acyltransferase PlsY [Mycoplasmopsis alligatoris]EFF41374.1 acyl-phosphate glycerol 3-phosphate acyltransferase [Mycoplasmopsis alligatoris A21JP2]
MNKIIYVLLVNLLILLIGYIIGSLNTSIILSRWKKRRDVRNYHSGNAGATNSLRAFGKKFALIVLISDIIKTYLTILCVSLYNYYHKDWAIEYNIIPTMAGFGVVLGHIYPIFFKFKGGKGAACSLGVLIGMNPLFLPIAAVFFFGIIFLTRYVSLASMVTSVVMIGFALIPWMITGPLGFGNYYADWYIPAIIYAHCSIFLIIAHRSNIKSLLKGTERKQGQSKK